MKDVCALIFAGIVLSACGGPPGPPGAAGGKGDPGDPGDPAERVVHRVVFSSFDNADSGVLDSRTLVFSKVRDDTAVKATYYDSLISQIGAASGPQGCRWTLLFNGSSCSDPLPIFGDVLAPVAAGGATTISGYCSASAGGALGAVEVTIQVSVGAIPQTTHGDCVSGYAGAVGYLEAEEIL